MRHVLVVLVDLRLGLRFPRLLWVNGSLLVSAAVVLDGGAGLLEGDSGCRRFGVDWRLVLGVGEGV